MVWKGRRSSRLRDEPHSKCSKDSGSWLRSAGSLLQRLADFARPMAARPAPERLEDVRRAYADFSVARASRERRWPEPSPMVIGGRGVSLPDPGMLPRMTSTHVQNHIRIPNKRWLAASLKSHRFVLLDWLIEFFCR